VCGGGCEVLLKIGVDGSKNENGRCCRAPIRGARQRVLMVQRRSPPPMVVAQNRGKLLDAVYSSALDIDAWQHSSSIVFATHVVEQGPHASRGVNDHWARNAGSVVLRAL